jgi:hypothetical protein
MESSCDANAPPSPTSLLRPEAFELALVRDELDRLAFLRLVFEPPGYRARYQRLAAKEEQLLARIRSNDTTIADAIREARDVQPDPPLREP